MPRDSIWQLFSLSSKFYILSIPLPPCSLSIQGGGWMSCLGTEHSASLVLSTLSCRKSLNHPHSLQREAPLPETGVAFVHQDNTDIRRESAALELSSPLQSVISPALSFHRVYSSSMNSLFWSRLWIHLECWLLECCSITIMPLPHKWGALHPYSVSYGCTSSYN